MSMKKMARYKKQALGLLLALVMVAGIIPGFFLGAPALANEENQTLAVSNTAIPAGPYRSLSLTTGGDVTEMRFTWQSQSETGSIRLYEAGGTIPVQSGDSTTQTLDTRVADTIYFPGEGEVSIVHQVTFRGLTPDTAYEYVVVGDGFESDRKPFLTGTKGSSFSFLVGGDPQIGVGEQIGGRPTGPESLISADLDMRGWLNSMATALDHTPDAAFYMPVGDQVHTRNHDASNPHAWAHSQYMHDILFSPPEFHSLPVAPVVGNHDGSGNNNVNHQLWHRHYNTPFDAANIRRHSTTVIGEGSGIAETSTGRAIETQFDYYMTWGNTLFLMLDSNTRSWPAGRLQWVEEVVAAHPDADWKVAVFHHAPYSVYRATNHTEKLETIPNILPELERLGFDVALTGHCHSYSRSHPMLSNTPILDQQWLDESGTIQQDLTGKQYNAVLDPEGIIYFAFNSATGSGYYNVNNMAGRDYVAYFNQNFRRNFTVVDVTENTFTVTTYQIDGNMFEEGPSPTTLVDVFTIVRGDDNGNVPAGVSDLRKNGEGHDLVQVNNPGDIYVTADATTDDIIRALPSVVHIETTLRHNDRGNLVAVRAVATYAGYNGRNVMPIMAPVTWDTSGIDASGTQPITITGTVTLPAEVNPAGVPTRASVIIRRVSMPFTDVSTDAPYATAVATTTRAGITNGTGGGQFAPDRLMTRAELAQVGLNTVKALFDDDTPTFTSSYTDVSESAWFYEAVSWSSTAKPPPPTLLPATALPQNNRFIYGYDGQFNPHGTVTLAEAVESLRGIMVLHGIPVPEDFDAFFPGDRGEPVTRAQVAQLLALMLLMK